MSRKRKFNSGGVITSGIALLFMAAPGGVCIAASSSDLDSSSSARTEEIVVYGEKSLQVLRMEVYRAQENFFAIFSALNLDDEYDIRCFYEVPSGTRQKKHVCRARFVEDARVAEVDLWRKDTPAMPASATIMKKKRHLRMKMELLIYDRPELYAALNEYSYAMQVYETERKRRCEGRIVCRR